MKVPVLGLVENMSWLKCPHCSERIDVFSMGGGSKTAIEMGVNFLGELPLDPVVRIGGDTGRSVAMQGESDERAAAFFELARRTVERVALESGVQGPQIIIED